MQQYVVVRVTLSVAVCLPCAFCPLLCLSACLPAPGTTRKVLYAHNTLRYPILWDKRPSVRRVLDIQHGNDGGYHEDVQIVTGTSIRTELLLTNQTKNKNDNVR